MADNVVTPKLEDDTPGQYKVWTPPLDEEKLPIVPEGEEIRGTKEGISTGDIPDWAQQHPHTAGTLFGINEALKTPEELAGLYFGSKAFGMPGAGLGYGLAKTRQTATEPLFDKSKKWSSVEQRLSDELPTNLIGGAAMDVGGTLTGKAVGKLQKGVTATKEAVASREAANQLGYPQTLAEQTGSKTWALIEKMLSYIPGSARTMQDASMQKLEKLTQFREALKKDVSGKDNIRQLEEITDEIRTTIDTMVGKKQGLKDQKQIDSVNEVLRRMGSTDTYESLQTEFKKALHTASGVARDIKNEIYMQIGEFIPEGDYAIPEVEKVARPMLEKELASIKPDTELVGMLKRLLKMPEGEAGIGPEALEHIRSFPAGSAQQQRAMQQLGVTQEMLDRATASMMPRNWKNLEDSRKRINASIEDENIAMKKKEFGFKGQASLSAPKYIQLKQALDKDMENIARESGTDAFNRLQLANKYYTDVYAPVWKDNKLIQKLAYSDPQAVIDTVFHKRTSLADVNNLVKAVGQDKYFDLQKGLVNRLIDKAYDTNGRFSWEALRKEMLKIGTEPLNAIFSRNTDKLNYFVDVVNRGVADQKLPVANKFFIDILKKSRPETIMNMIFRPHNVENIRLLKTVLPKDLFDEATASWLGEKVVPLNMYGLVRPQMSAKEMSKIDEKTLDALLPKEEQKRFFRNMQEVMKSSTRLESVAGNPSGSGQSVITFEIGMGVVTAGSDVAGGIVTGEPRRVMRGLEKGATALLLPKALAKVYLSDTATKLFTKGMSMPKRSPEAVKLLTELLALVGRDAYMNIDRKDIADKGAGNEETLGEQVLSTAAGAKENIDKVKDVIKRSYGSKAEEKKEPSFRDPFGIRW